MLTNGLASSRAARCAEALERKNDAILRELTGYTIVSAFEYIDKDSVKEPEKSVLLFKGVCSAPETDLTSSFKKSSVSVEQYRPDDVVTGLYTKETWSASEKELGAARRRVGREAPKDVSNESKLVSFLCSFYEKVFQHRYDYHVCGNPIPPLGFSSVLKEVLSLVSSLDSLPGNNESKFYFGSLFSSTAFLDEDPSLNSINVLRAGAPTVWIVVDHSSWDVILNGFSQLMVRAGQTLCSLSLFHKCYLLSPELLNQLGVKYTIFVQRPGDMVFVRGGAFHSVINTGLNLSEAFNYGDSIWNVGDTSTQIATQCPECKSQRFIPFLKPHFLCTIFGCGGRFNTRDELTLHEQKFHPGPKIKCPECSKTFSQFNLMRQHQQRHTGAHKRVCPKCGKLSSRLSDHLMRCDDGTFVTCEICQKKYNPDNQENHLAICRGCVCSFCKRKFADRRYLGQHEPYCLYKIHMKK